MFSREEIIKKLVNREGKLFNRFAKTYPEMHQHIMDSFSIPDLDALTAYYCWYHQIEPKICPVCGKSKSSEFFNKGYDDHPYCSRSCWPDEYRKYVYNDRHDKRKATNLERFGVDNPYKSEYIKTKIKKTIKEKYGVDHALQNKEVRAKSKQTNTEKYGVEYPMQSEEVKEKLKATNLERYGVDHPMQCEEVKYKIKATNLERYGVDHGLQSEEVRAKIKKTNLKKYGVDYALQSEEVKEKIKATNLEKYGVEHRSQKHISQETLDIINSREEFKSLCEKHEYNTTLVGKELGTTPNTALNYIRKHALDIPPNIKSYLEQELIQFIESLGITNYIVNDRRILGNKEIDLYLPDYKVGIEMDGVYWHSVDKETESNKKNNHMDKVLIAREKGIKLIQFYEDEWNDKRLTCESIIKNALGLGNNKLYARKLSIKEIPSGMAKVFCDNNHLSGGVYSKLNIGLFDGSLLVQVATFSKNRFSKDKHWELIRLCASKNHNVVGGASRLIKKFFEITNASELTSFSDNRIGQGNVYKTIGFELVHETSPGYFWFVDGVRYHRIKYQKHKLTEMDGYSPDKTEDMIMFENGHRKIYDSGNRKWIISIQNK